MITASPNGAGGGRQRKTRPGYTRRRKAAFHLEVREPLCPFSGGTDAVLTFRNGQRCLGMEHGFDSFFQGRSVPHRPPVVSRSGYDLPELARPSRSRTPIKRRYAPVLEQPTFDRSKEGIVVVLGLVGNEAGILMRDPITYGTPIFSRLRIRNETNRKCDEDPNCEHLQKNEGY